jgi:hypothetical protein
MNRSGTQLQDAADASALYAVRSATVKNLDDEAVSKAAAVFLESSYDAEDVSDASGDDRNDIETTILSRSPTTVEVTATRVVDLPFGFLRGEDGSMTVTRTSTAVEALNTPITLLLLDRTSPVSLARHRHLGPSRPRGRGDRELQLAPGAGRFRHSRHRDHGHAGGWSAVRSRQLGRPSRPSTPARSTTPTPRSWSGLPPALARRRTSRSKRRPGRSSPARTVAA